MYNNSNILTFFPYIFYQSVTFSGINLISIFLFNKFKNVVLPAPMFPSNEQIIFVVGTDGFSGEDS